MNELVVKVLVPRGQASYEQIRDNWHREIRSLLTLRHPNITYFYDAFEFNDTFYIVIERCAGSLTELFRLPNYQGSVWFMPIARCILQGINYIHLNNYVHKDIHPGNVFYTFVRDELRTSDINSKAITFKIGDLGISRLESEIDVFNTTLAQWMVPPEFLNSSEFGTVGKQTDIYHAALLLLSVLRGSVPTFTRDDILKGAPRQMAETFRPPIGPALARALRRHVSHRIKTPFNFWKALNGHHNAKGQV